MSTNGVNNDDTEMAECDGEKVVTMMDVLQEQQEFEDDANAVLGASDDKNCTYSEGYIKRQAVYACLTCCGDAKLDPSKRAGVCLACSLTCHENHDLVELYTKRKFCCDCGNPKFNHPCQYTPNKTNLNDDNIYNQNFSGLYCTCHRPYPDPDGDEEEMIQCIICEDWLHASHLEATVPSSELYAEMICKACMEKNEFLHDYGKYAVNGDVDVVDISDILDGSNQSSGNKYEVNGADAKIELNASNNMNVSKDNNTENAQNGTSVDEINNTNDVLENKSEELAEGIAIKHDDALENKCKELAEGIATKQDDGLQNKSEELAEGITTKHDDALEKKSEELAERIDTKHNDALEKKSEELSEGIATTDDAAVENKSEELTEGITTKNDDALENKSEELAEGIATKRDDAFEDKSKELAEGIARNRDALENKSEELAQQQGSVSEETDVEKLAENSSGKEDVSGKAEDENSTQHQAKDTNQNLSSDEITDSKSGENLNTGDSPVNQENLQDAPMVSSETKEQQSAVDDDKNNEIKLVTADENMEDSKIENGTDCSQKLTECDASVEQPTKMEEDIELKVDSQEKQEDPSDTTLMSATNKIGEMDGEGEHVTDDHTKKDEEIKDNKRKLTTEVTMDNVCIKKPKLNQSTCVRPQGEKKMFKGATFWPTYFRQKLCTCTECITMYKDLSVLFLIDPEDTVTAYEALGKEKANGTASTQYEKGLEALSSLGRIQQINALTEYNKMRDKLLDFLKSFKDRKEVVKEEDIKAFFAGMKPKREPDGVYFCR